MATSRYTFVLDLHSTFSQITLPVTVGDTDRELVISFSDGGRSYSLEDAAIAHISVKRPSKTELTRSCVIDKEAGTVSYAFEQDTCPIAGLHNCQIILYNDTGKKIASPRFALDAAERVVDDENITIPDETQTALDEIFVKEIARQNSEIAREAAEALRVEAEEKRQEDTSAAVAEITDLKESLEEMRDNGEFDGDSGVGISSIEINTSGHLVITYTNGIVVDVGRVVGKDGSLIDNALSSTSINPVQNKVIYKALEDKEKIGTADAKVEAHNTRDDSHNDIRLLVEGLTQRLNTLANSDDNTLDQTKEIVDYIKNNRELIEGITTGKVNVADIVNNLTSNVSNKPLSAAQGVVLKALIDAVPAWAKASTKPSYSASEVGAVPNTRKVNGQALSEDVNIDIPDSLAELTDDAAHRTVSDTEKGTWNAKSDFSGSYNDLKDKPSIPSIAGLASTGYVDAKVAAIVDSSPEALNTLNELASSLGNDPNFATTVSTAIGKKVDKTTTVNGHALSGNVTLDKSDIGLGNVPNVATNDQTPTFTEASALANINTGEKISVLFGKIKKAITDLIAHIASKNNPHGVTKSQVGLGNVDNKSSETIRSEITSDNVTDALGYEPASTAVATSSANGLMSAADNKKLGETIPYSGQIYASDIYATGQNATLFLGTDTDTIVVYDYNLNPYALHDVIEKTNELCRKVGISEVDTYNY